jgi:hypothetical protein
MTPGANEVYRNDLSGDCLPPREQLVQFLSEQVDEEVAGPVSGQDQNNITIPESPDAITDIQPDWRWGGEDPERNAVRHCIFEIQSFLKSRGDFLRTYVAGKLDSRSLEYFFIHSIPSIHRCIALDYDELRKFNNNISPFHLPTDQLLRCIPRCELLWQAGRDRRKEIFRLLRRLNMVSALARSDVGPLEELLPELEHYSTELEHYSTELEHYLKTLEHPTAREIPGGDGGTDPTYPDEPLVVAAAGVAGERGDAGEPTPVEEECSPSRTRRGKNEERDKLVYELCCDGIPYKNIRTILKNEHPDWGEIESNSGVIWVARKYAESHGLEPPPRRHHPRQQR